MATNRIHTATIEGIQKAIAANEETDASYIELWKEQAESNGYRANRYMIEYPETILRNRAYNNIIRNIITIADERQVDAAVAMAIAFFNNVNALSDNLRSTSSGGKADEQELLARADFLNDCTYGYVYDAELGYLDSKILATLYSKYMLKKARQEAIAAEKAKRVHEKEFGVRFNPVTEKVLSWQGVRKSLKDAGYDIVKKGETGINVTGSKYDGIQVHIVGHEVRDYVEYTDEELESKGYFLVDDVWHRKDYWNEHGVMLRDYNLKHWVPNQDKIDALIEKGRELENTLKANGYVVHENQYSNTTNGIYKLDVTGWKVG